MQISSCKTDDPATDIVLLAAWRAGDMRAARTLYRRHFDAVCRFFRNKLSNLEEVADLVGETFLELLKSRARESWSDTRIVCLRYFLLGIARNVLFGHFRRNLGRKLEHLTSDELEQRSLEELAPRSMSSIVGGRRELDVLIRALRRLPLREQILLEAKYFEYLPDSELAQLVEIPISTLPGRLRTARNRLLAEVQRLTAVPHSEHEPDPGAALDRWTAELRVLIVRTNPRPRDEANGS
jgi:RNA polymerase sigma factor (sigma-70 family)